MIKQPEQLINHRINQRIKTLSIVITISEAQTKRPELINRVESSEKVVITQSSRLKFKLVLQQSTSKKRQFGQHAG